jgi:hypothetical protein
MNVKLHVLVYSIANIMQIVHILCGSNKDILRGMDTKTTSLNVIHIRLLVERLQQRVLYT